MLWHIITVISIWLWPAHPCNDIQSNPSHIYAVIKPAKLAYKRHAHFKYKVRLYIYAYLSHSGKAFQKNHFWHSKSVQNVLINATEQNNTSHCIFYPLQQFKNSEAEAMPFTSTRDVFPKQHVNRSHHNLWNFFPLPWTANALTKLSLFSSTSEPRLPFIGATRRGERKML